MGASGSSQMSARLFVPSGSEPHFKGGDTSAPSQVYLPGIIPPSSNAELVSSMVPPSAVAKGNVNRMLTKKHIKKRLMVLFSFIISFLINWRINKQSKAS
jgi:hypothetical protein